MCDAYPTDELPFTVEDWTDPNHLEVIAACRSAPMANAAWNAAVKQKPGRKLVARWGRAWTMRRSWDD
jgi:hypothetical protein